MHEQQAEARLRWGGWQSPETVRAGGAQDTVAGWGWGAAWEDRPYCGLGS